MYHQGKEIYTVIGPVNFLHAGATGRLKYALIDFNEDGLLDLFEPMVTMQFHPKIQVVFLHA